MAMKKKYHDPNDHSKGWMLVKDDKRSGDGATIFGKSQKEWKSITDKKKKDVQKYFSKAERTKRKKDRMVKKSGRVARKVLKRKAKTKRMEDRNKKRISDASKMKRGGSVGSSVKTYGSGGYVEGK
jgi:hypothetical protein